MCFYGDVGHRSHVLSISVRMGNSSLQGRGELEPQELQPGQGMGPHPVQSLEGLQGIVLGLVTPEPSHAHTQRSRGCPGPKVGPQAALSH